MVVVVKLVIYDSRNNEKEPSIRDKYFLGREQEEASVWQQNHYQTLFVFMFMLGC